MSSVAVFWDRDKTLIEDPGYISSRDQVKLMPGASEALKRLSAAGFQNIIATNQSGIARGLLDESTLELIHERLRELLAAEGATVDDIYYCPYLPGDEAVVEAYRRDSDLRKPKPGMLIKASLERKIDLAGSWSIGDSLRDAEAGRAAGCRTVVIVEGPAARGEIAANPAVDFVAGSLQEAVEIVLKHSRSRNPASGADLSPDVADTLQKILGHLKMIDRRHQTEDFSLNRLIGSVFQLLAVLTLVYGVFNLIGNASAGTCMITVLYVIALQLIALTFFILALKR